MKQLLFNSLFLILVCGSTASFAQDTYRVLVLHSGWHERIWDREFDRLFSDALTAREGAKVEISFQNLGIDKNQTPETRGFYVNNIEAIVQEQKVDMLVALLPAAIEFVQEIESFQDIPTILVLPSNDFDLSTFPKETTRVIKSNSDVAILNSIEAARALNPEASVVEFFSGSSQIDLAYMARARILSNNYPEELSFRFHSGLPVSELAAYTSELNQDSIVVFLPFSSFSSGESADAITLMPVVSEASGVPIYGIADSWLGLGILGGYFVIVDKYANAASLAASSLIHQHPLEEGDLQVSGDFIYDYAQLTKWGYDLEALNQPFLLRGKPRTILDDHSGFIYTIALLIFLLVIALGLQYLMLKRSEIAKKELQDRERQARENEARFELLTRNSLDVIWTWSGEKQLATYYSSSIEQLTGYTPEEFIALPMDQVMTVPLKEFTLQDIFKKESGPLMFEVELTRKDGHKVWCEVAAQPIGGSDVNRNDWVGVTRDVSIRKKAEKERLALENQVRQSQKFESLGTLAGGIAHDFNNMLGVIMGLTELLKLKMPDNAEALLIADKLLSTTDKAKAMVGQILAFSRQSTGNKAVTDIHELMVDTIQLIQTGIPKSINLNYGFTDKAINVLGDANQLSQVFINTLTNAYEAIDEQEGTIFVDIAESHFDHKVKLLHGELPAGSYAKVTVADNGSGLKAEEIEKMFDPFYTSKELGNGMGLAIVRGVVIGHGGAIDIHSEPNKGTTVSIYIPVTEQTAIAPEAADFHEYEGEKSTIMLVDDQTDLLETMSLMLQELGHHCIPCSDPQQALDLIASDNASIDLVITDYSMPSISGMEVREFSAKHRPDLPVILATGYSDRISEDTSDDEDTEYILNKPFGFGELKSMLNKML